MGEKWGKMGKKWVRNEVTGVQKTVLMHASAHLAGVGARGGADVQGQERLRPAELPAAGPGGPVRCRERAAADGRAQGGAAAGRHVAAAAL